MSLILLRSNIMPLIIQPFERKRYLNSVNLRNVKGKSFQYFKYMLKQLVKSVSIFETSFGYKIDSTIGLMKIAEFAKFCEVPVSTIRYYLRIKKIIPIGHTDSGYALFDRKQKSLIRP